MSTFFQAGLFLAFLQGIYESNVTFKLLSEYGDTGLGTFNRLDGEMIAVDGIFYRINSHGVAAPITDFSITTPFAIVTKFHPSINLSLKHSHVIHELNHFLDIKLKNRNIFYLFKIDGEFEYLHLRSEKHCTGAVKSLATTLPSLQKEFTVNHIKGTLIATWCPAYSSVFTIPGYHYHFIDEERKTGGHVFAFKLLQGEINIMPLWNFNVLLFDTHKFSKVDLTIDINNALKEFQRQFPYSKDNT